MLYDLLILKRRLRTSPESSFPEMLISSLGVESYPQPWFYISKISVFLATYSDTE